MIRQGVTVILLVTAAVTALAVYRLRQATEAPLPPAPVGPPPPADRADVPALPAYIINVAYGPIELQTDAGADGNGPPLLVTSGDPIEIVVRPERAISEKVTVRLYWRKGDRLKRWRSPYEQGPHSTFRYRGPGERPFGRGWGSLVAVVSPVEDVPDEIPVAWLERPPKHWAVLKQNVRWR